MSERYSVDCLTSVSRSLTLASAARELARHGAAGRLASVARESDAATLGGVNGFYWPPYTTPPKMTDAERSALCV